MDLYKYNQAILPRVEWNEQLFPYAYIVSDLNGENYHLYGSNQPLVYNNSLRVVTKEVPSTIMIYECDGSGWHESEEVENIWLSDIVWSNIDIFDFNRELYFSGAQEEYYKYVPPTEFIIQKPLNMNPVLSPIYVKKSDEQIYKIIFVLIPDEDENIPANLRAIVEYQKPMGDDNFITVKKSNEYEQISENQIAVYLNKNMTSQIDNFYLKITLSDASGWTNIFSLELVVEE